MNITLNPVNTHQMSSTLSLENLSQQNLIDVSWVKVLAPVQGILEDIAGELEKEQAQGVDVFPASHKIMRAFKAPFESINVVIVGQDPYPTPGDAMGLSFSVSPEQRVLPRSLNNIFTELSSDVGVQKPASGDLSPWAEQGVMLLNRVLTVRSGEAGSHRRLGWETVTECALRALDNRSDQGVVAVLWGNDAHTAQSFLPHSTVITSAHPSPLSASRGFFGSRPFSKVNEALTGLGKTPINWALPHETALF